MQAQSVRPVPFIYMRHGKTDFNALRLYMGSTDRPLNDLGRQQAEAAKKRLVGLGIKTICCSPLKRAHQTALIVNETLHVPIHRIHNLRECYFGSMEGTKVDKTSNWIALWKSGEKNPDGMSTFEEFKVRVTQGLNEALSYPGPVLVIAHGGVYWAVAAALGLSDSVVTNCVPFLHQPYPLICSPRSPAPAAAAVAECSHDEEEQKLPRNKLALKAGCGVARPSAGTQMQAQVVRYGWKASPVGISWKDALDSTYPSTTHPAAKL